MLQECDMAKVKLLIYKTALFPKWYWKSHLETEVALLLNALVFWVWQVLIVLTVVPIKDDFLCFSVTSSGGCCPRSHTGEGSARFTGLQTVWQCWLACLKQTRLKQWRWSSWCGQMCISWDRNHSYTVHSNTAEKLQATSSGLWYQLSWLVQTKWNKYKDTCAVLELRIVSGRHLIAERESNVLEDPFLYIDIPYNFIPSKSCTKMISNCSSAFKAAVCCP